MLPEAIVIESLLDAHGIRFVLAGKDIVSQCPQFNILFGGVSFLVDAEDLETAKALIDGAEDVPGYRSIESAGFERRPVRNAILAFAMLIIGAPFPFWYRGHGTQAAAEA
jgi:hypothetical protein